MSSELKYKNHSEKISTILEIAPIYRLLKLCCIGTAIEWYNFSLFGALLPILADLFFPETDKNTARIWSFTLFTAALIFRPLGSLLFGFLGDRFGRSRSILLSVLLMGAATLTIGCLPTYPSIGLWAPLLLASMRLLQGLSVSGELAGIYTYLSEFAPPHRRYFMLALGDASAILGGVLGICLCAGLTSLFSQTALIHYGWRLLFLIGGIGAVCSFVMRLYLIESPVYKEMKHAKQLIKLPFLTILKTYKLNTLLITGAFLMSTVIYHILFYYMPMEFIYNHQIDMNTVFILNTSLLFIVMISEPVFGWLSDKFNPFYIQLLGSAGIMISIIPFLLMKNTLTLFIVLGCVLSISLSAFIAPLPVLTTILFPDNARYSGTALAYNLPIALFGGTAPLLMIGFAHLSYPVFYQSTYILSTTLVSLICVRQLHRKLQILNLNLRHLS